MAPATVPRVRRVVSLDEVARELAQARRNLAAAAAQEFGEGDVPGELADLRAHAVDLSPEVADALAASVARPPVIAGKLRDGERCGIDDVESRADLAVDELRAELDGEWEIGEMERVNAAADARTGLDETDTLTGA